MRKKEKYSKCLNLSVVDIPIMRVPLAEFKILPIWQAELAELADGNDYIDVSLSSVS